MATKWEQVKKFDPKKMGTRPGYCLYNVRIGFGITKGKYPSAKLDMEANKKAGTLHPMSTLPKNVAVPVYADTTSVYEHIMVCDKGTYYSDGKKLASGAGWKYFGWGETCDGVRVVKKVTTTTTTTTTTPTTKKSNEEIAKEVIAGKWGNNPDRKKKLEAAGYNYNTIQELVEKELAGNNKVYYAVRRGDNLSAIAKKYGTTVAQIMKWNSAIKDASLIYPGQRIRVK